MYEVCQVQVNLSSGNYTIIDSGYAFLFGQNDDLEIHMVADDGFEVSVVLKFSDDLSEEQQIKKDISGNTVVLSCMNFQDNGTGLASPISIAVVDGRELYFMFWSYREGESKVRSVKYTLFYEK